MTRTSIVRLAAFCSITLVATIVAHRAAAQEPPECLSMNPGDWPAPARPYFMLVVDTSGSMTACTTPPTSYPTECNQNAGGYQLNSCGMVPNRINDAKCALRQTVLAFGGQVNFGMATFASYLSSCPGNCQSDCGTPNGGTCGSDVYGCGWNVFPNASPAGTACGNFPACSVNGQQLPSPPNFAEGSWRNGGNVVVPMLQDPWWLPPPPPASNVSTLLEWFDGSCANNRELFAAGGTPIAGSLRSAAQYLRAGWDLWSNSDYCVTNPYLFSTPMDAADRACRSVNVILVTDGDESCDGATAPVIAANDLFTNGVSLGGKNWPVRTYVINFAGGNQTATDQIAAAGGTGSSLFATNEVQLAQALAGIIADAVEPEVCDNTDNNCNGCSDEGYAHYCNVGQTCCTWTNLAQRDQCIANYEQSVANNPPDGDLTLLPCTSSTQQQQPATWLCYDPGDVCDQSDNNCDGNLDEGQLKCGNPPHCPTAEVCNSQDDDCDAQTDEDGVCGNCSPSPEVCDGCDNDCDGIVDNGTFPAIGCGLPTPPNCQGTAQCQPPQPAPAGPGTCALSGGYGGCNNNPQSPDSCDGIDNDCDQQIDEDFLPTTCEPTNNPPGLAYGGTSQCTYGSTQCQNGSVVCVGGTGPSAEVCDGIDNDCDGTVDDNVFGVGQTCGINNPPCMPGTTQCVNGALVCQGGVGPQTEVCDGADNDCDGNVDEAPLGDAPAPNQSGCWNQPGTCCSHGTLTWCPPLGGSCYGNGSLSPPCNKGTLVCSGGAWTCQNPVGPQPEVCDGVDNNCNGQTDEGNLPGEGQTCGPTTPPCMPGLTDCVNGSIQCVGGVQPAPEQCNNVDDDCNGQIDDGIPNMGACNVPFDPLQYPNSNSMTPPCQPGQLECDGMGNWICVGGKGPSPEVCDGIDNDCDTNIDEAGAQPDGIDGSANPFPPPAANLGQSCQTPGVCGGNYMCLNGLFICGGGTPLLPESCDCEDNDCDGLTDEPPGQGEPPLCSPGKDCVKTSTECQCAEPCGGGEYPCPPGQKCEQVRLSGGGVGNYCVTDYDALCGDCSKKTVTDDDNQVVCAPLGTDPPGCLSTPVCQCKGQDGCREPCHGVTCGPGEVCAEFGPKAGECVDPNNCYLTGCPGCNKACHAEACGEMPSCVDNPCDPDACPGDVAKPNADFSACECVGSCADVVCPAGQKCQQGSCVPWCDPPCAADKVCDPTTLGCIDTMCTPTSCENGGTCDPISGQCCDDPCTGILCPDGQICAEGECVEDGSGGDGGAGGGSGAVTSGAGATGPADAVGIWGLPTGGGGCGCRVGEPDEIGWRAWALLALALGIAGRRRSTRGRAAR